MKLNLWTILMLPSPFISIDRGVSGLLSVMSGYTWAHPWIADRPTRTNFHSSSSLKCLLFIFLVSISFSRVYTYGSYSAITTGSLYISESLGRHQPEFFSFYSSGSANRTGMNSHLRYGSSGDKFHPQLDNSRPGFTRTSSILVCLFRVECLSSGWLILV